MAKTVGYACAVKLRWLNKTVELVHENLEEADFKAKLNEYLSFEIDSAINLRKTREILMHTWYYDDEIITPLRREALELIDKCPDYAIPIHLCLIYLAYPVFADVCKYMGKLFLFEDEVTNTMVCRKMYDEWGERNTIKYVPSRVTLTLKELNLLEAEKKTRYRVKHMNVTCESIVNYMLETAMRVSNNSYYSLTDLKDFSILFPFKYQVTKEQLMSDSRFVLTNFDGKLSVALNDVK